MNILNIITNYIHTIPDDNNTNLHLFILDPLTVIIKLAIISNKPIGTKIRINNNVIYLQEPGPLQGIYRYILKNNKTEIQYLYNPIEIACNKYLTKKFIEENPKIKELFVCAQNGVLKLIETYKMCSIMRMCLNHYYSLISNYIDEKNDECLFRKDNMTPFYTEDKLQSLAKIWTKDKITIILNLTTFLLNDENAETNVKSLETIIDGIDTQVSLFLS
jgi:hypothetical protein